jgi:hypothetical protein
MIFIVSSGTASPFIVASTNWAIAVMSLADICHAIRYKGRLKSET